MLKRSIMIVVMVLSCNVYASQQYDKHSCKKAVAGIAGTTMFSSMANEMLKAEKHHPNYNSWYMLLAKSGGMLAVVSATYTVKKMYQCYTFSAEKE